MVAAIGARGFPITEPSGQYGWLILMAGGTNDIRGDLLRAESSLFGGSVRMAGNQADEAIMNYYFEAVK